MSAPGITYYIHFYPTISPEYEDQLKQEIMKAIDTLSSNYRENVFLFRANSEIKNEVYLSER